jgi:hypothetical protein
VKEERRMKGRRRGNGFYLTQFDRSSDPLQEPKKGKNPHVKRSVYRYKETKSTTGAGSTFQTLNLIIKVGDGENLLATPTNPPEHRTPPGFEGSMRFPLVGK